jgi:hypothetical protein
VFLSRFVAFFVRIVFLFCSKSDFKRSLLCDNGISIFYESKGKRFICNCFSLSVRLFPNTLQFKTQEKFNTISISEVIFKSIFLG